MSDEDTRTQEEIRLADLLKISREAARIDKNRAELFEVMVRTPGWVEYKKLLGALIQDRIDQMTSPAGSVDRAIALEYVKGSFGGLMLALNLPETIIEAMKTVNVATEDNSDD